MSIRTCRGCQKTEEYNPDNGWMWYGSIRDWEDSPSNCIYTCSDSCRERLYGSTWRDQIIKTGPFA